MTVTGLKRTLLLVLFVTAIALLAWAVADGKTLRTEQAHYTVYKRSLTEEWPKTYARFDRRLTLQHAVPYTSGGAMTLFTPYTYRIEGTACKGNRFEFTRRETDHAVLAPNDPRLHQMLKEYCPEGVRKVPGDKVMKYIYSCYPVPVYYDPNDICTAYMVKPLNPQALETQMHAAVKRLWIKAGLKVLLALICLVGCAALFIERRKAR